MARTTTLQKIMLFSMGVLVGLLLVEAGLRLAGFILLSLQESGNRLSNDEIRILALGESTTANLFDGESSWPDELETILNNNSDRRFNVINKGLAGAKTAFIVSELDRNLDRYKPDIVITMMGINDIQGDSFRYSFMEDEKRFYEHLKVYDLIRWSFERPACGKDMSPDPYISGFWALLKDNRYEEALQAIQDKISKDKNNGELYIALAYAYNLLGNRAEAEQALEKAIEAGGPDTAYDNLGNLYRLEGFSENETLLMLQQKGFRYVETPLSAEKLVHYHYNLLSRKLQDRGITHIAMQYPVLSVDSLKNMLAGDVLYVSNENFIEAIENESYEAYFWDKFGDKFGHCTLKGNRLIAENAAEVVLEAIN